VRDNVEIALALQGLTQFVSGSKRASESIDHIGTSTEQTGKKAKLGWKSVAMWGGASAIAYGAGRFLTGAVKQTGDLAKATLGLQKTTGLDTQTASAWIGVLKERNISSDQFRMSVTKLSREMQLANGGSKSAIQSFHDLGISQKLVASGNTEAVIGKLADSFHRMKNPADRAALAQIMLGRAGNKLLPILSSGSAGIREALGVQIKYHNVLSGKSLKSTMDTVRQQRELNAAYQGVKLQLGTALMPVLITLLGIILKITNALEPLLSNSKLLTGVIITLTAAYVAYSAATIVATALSLGLDAALLPWIGLGILIAAGIVALGIAFYEAYKHIKVFREGVQYAWAWIKKHWPLLLGIMVGPVGLAVILIVRHFDKVKDVALAIVHAIRHAFEGLIKFVKSIPSKLGGVASHIPGFGLASKVAGGAGSIASHLNPFHWQHGGVQPWSGPAIVGEAGPELVNLPGGAQITPLGGGFTVEVPVYLDKKQIALAIGQFTADRKARR
jgi:hypothetical protein